MRRAMFTRTLSFVILLFWTAVGVAGDLNGKLGIQAGGREQAIFDKATVKFEKQNPRVRTRLTEPEGDALKALKDGTVDLVVLGRNLSPEEKGLTGTVVGWEGIAIMVNASNRVMEANKKQVVDIFTGKAKTWDELGGLESRITVVEREEGKGVRPYFEKLLGVDGNLAKGKGVVEPDKEAIKVVAGNLNAVSYLDLNTGLANVTVGVPIRLLSIDRVEPEPSNVSSGAYPFRRPIVMVTKNPPSPLAKAFIDFMLDKEGQKTVLEEEFVPLFVTK
jgi:phosphate transport system substrate-binding protein